MGQTACTPEKRFEQHMNGYRASRHVRGHGLRLRPDLYGEHNPLPTRKAAEVKEAWIAEELKRQGYTVYSG